MSYLNNYILNPYKEAYQASIPYFHNARTSDQWIRKVTHFSLGCVLRCPLLNVIALIALRKFSKTDSDTTTSIIFHPNPNMNENHQDFLFFIEWLTNNDYIEIAWNEYVIACRGEVSSSQRIEASEAQLGVIVPKYKKLNELQNNQSQNIVNEEILAIQDELFKEFIEQVMKLENSLQQERSSLSQAEPLISWSHFPPLKLIKGMMVKLGEPTEILAHLPIELIRDCAIRYPELASEILKEDCFWECFNAYPEYIADIARQNPNFVFTLIAGVRGASILRDDYRLEIFQSALPTILSSIENGVLGKKEMENLSSFLLRYRLTIDQQNFDSIKSIQIALKEAGEKISPAHIKMIGFVIGKLSLQGIYREGKNLLLSFDEEKLISIYQMGHAYADEREIVEVFQDLELDNEVEQAINFLLYIPKESFSYAQVRMTLGHIWMEQEEFVEAGKCFLQAIYVKGDAGLDPAEKEASLMLAISCLLLSVNSKEYIARDVTHEEAKKLSPDQCRYFVENPKLFIETIRKAYSKKSPQEQKFLDDLSKLC